MNNIKCPKCGHVFDEKQIIDTMGKQVNEEVEKRLEKELVKHKQDWDNLSKTQLALRQEQLMAQEKENLNKLQTQKDSEISKLQKELALSQERQRASTIEKEQAVLQQTTELNNKLKDIENRATIKINELRNELDKKELERQNSLSEQKSSYEMQIKLKEEELKRERDFKSKQNTKLLGETLEQHCEIAFEKLRAMAFSNAYFKKDNVVAKGEDELKGSKGDYIFKDYLDIEKTIELVSIMFDMKNEQDDAVNKKRNEEHFAQLDKNRNKKNCEYAVLVSTLEKDNDYYNDGIVDVSHVYPKMFVIRPQFFTHFIGLVRSFALKNANEKKELVEIKQQNIDITGFEQQLQEFKEGFSNNYRLANENFNNTIKDIDKSIESLQKAKDDLIKTGRQLGLANNKLDELTIRKLTKNNPTMKAKFDALHLEQSKEVYSE